MSAERLSMKRILFFTGIGYTATAAVMLAALYLLTDSVRVVLYGLIFVLLFSVWASVFIALTRKKLSAFSSAICRTLDDMINGNIASYLANEEETLLTKINHRLTRLYEAMKENSRRAITEKAALQEWISDISHQVKMPIANLKMVNATLLEQDVPEDKRREFLRAAGEQLDKLDFLMQAMIKMSRLETGVITFSKKDSSIYETLAAALGGILLTAEKKSINVSVDCPEDLIASHDRRWTTEALFNILDNAVKYTANGGNIHVTAARLEMYTRIDVADTGKGISESNQATIFKRFYREEEVHEIEGIGIGLYLAREIITMQGGYIRVISEAGKGSTFSIYLLNK